MDPCSVTVCVITILVGGYDDTKGGAGVEGAGGVLMSCIAIVV